MVGPRKTTRVRVYSRRGCDLQLGRLMNIIAMAASAKPKQIHIVFLPFWTTSHIIPLVDIAKLFAATQRVRATIITTPHNALIFETSLHRSVASGHQISVRTLPFPASEVGLPEGIENYGDATSPEMTRKIGHAFMLLQKPTEELISSIRPDCIFSDMFFPWSADLAAQLKIPRLLFYPNNFLCRSVVHNLKTYVPHEKVSSDDEPFLVPFLPGKIEMKRSQIDAHIKTKTPFGDLLDAITQSEALSYGLVHYTCYELEPAYADFYKKNVVKGGNGNKVWSIGPLSQFWNIGGMKLKEVDVSSTKPRHVTLTWLDSQRANSVLYVCFDSMTRFRKAQLTQIALALEASNESFIWVVRSKDSDGEEGDDWLPIGFEERNKEKGLIMREWVPQMEILGHPAIAGFMSHCGWNSVLEAITANVPMITWPLFAEHFYIEKLINDVLRIGVAGVGAEFHNEGFEITAGPVIEKEKIEIAIRRLMDSGSRSKEFEERMREVSLKAKRAVQEGGSSYNNLMDIIEEIENNE